MGGQDQTEKEAAPPAGEKKAEAAAPAPGGEKKADAAGPEEEAAAPEAAAPVPAAEAKKAEAAAPAAAEAPKKEEAKKEEPKKEAPKKADGESSASQVVGGGWKPPKGPSPEDDVLMENWKNEGKLHILEGVWCKVPYKVTVIPDDNFSGDSAAARAKAVEVCEGVIKEATEVFSHFEPDSEVSKINKLEVGTVHAPSPSMKKVLETVGHLNRMTRGVFDPAILAVTECYKQNDAKGAEEAKAYSKWSCFTVTDAGIEKTNAGSKLDLCGLAKGWAIDEIAQRLKDGGFKASYVDWGGDIKVFGQHPAGRNWNVAVIEPPAEDCIGATPAEGSKQRFLAHIDLRDGQSIATSGDYLQTLAKGTSHIVDPRNGAPVKITGDTCASVSVVSLSCMIADALATAAMASGTVKDGRRLLDQFRGAAFKDPVTDYCLYSRTGPRVVRYRDLAQELPEHREARLENHEAAHVIVVGGGLAGVSAAIEASKAKAKVTLIEKESDLGGNSAKATSGINAWGTRVQKQSGIEDDGRFFERDTHVSAKGGQSDLGCVSTLSEKSAEAIHWLMDELGVPLTALSQLGGHARRRTHRVPPRADGAPVPVGFTIMQHARAAAAAFDNITVKTRCSMQKLLQETTNDGAPEVLGIVYKDEETGETHELKADSVVITTGGFGYDHTTGSLMQKHRPDLVGVPTTNGAFATGDGIKFGSEIGATLVDMDKVQLHPTAFINPKDPGAHTKYLGPEALRGSGGILMDQQGRRFVNELDLRSVVSQKILDHCDAYKMPDGKEYRPWSWCVLNEESQEKFGRPMLSFYKDQVGLFEAVEGTKGLAELMGCDEQNVIDSLKEYAAACDTKICSKTGKVVFPSRVCETDQSFIVARITPCIHYCMGGLEITPVGEVLRKNKQGAIGKRQKIKRLFAAGECTGGVHGGNRLGGNSLLECVVFGRLAGDRAATVNQKSTKAFDSSEWIPVTLREVRSTDAKFGHSTAVYRFNLHGSLQKTGLEVGRFIAIRSEMDGDTLTGYYSPVSRPEDEGIIDILCRTDEKGGPIVNVLLSLKPGASCMMRGMGGCKLIRQPNNKWTHEGREINRISLLCGGTGLAPAVQIARAYVNSITGPESPRLAAGGGIKIVYAAESVGDLSFVTAFDGLKARYPELVSIYLVLNSPPKGWTEGIGFVDADTIRQRLWFPPSDDHQLVMCGPPIFENIMCKMLAGLGYPREQYYSFANDPQATQ